MANRMVFDAQALEEPLTALREAVILERLCTWCAQAHPQIGSSEVLGSVSSFMRQHRAARRP